MYIFDYNIDSVKVSISWSRCSAGLVDMTVGEFFIADSNIVTMKLKMVLQPFGFIPS